MKFRHFRISLLLLFSLIYFGCSKSDQAGDGGGVGGRVVISHISSWLRIERAGVAVGQGAEVVMVDEGAQRRPIARE